MAWVLGTKKPPKLLSRVRFSDGSPSIMNIEQKLLSGKIISNGIQYIKYSNQYDIFDLWCYDPQCCEDYFTDIVEVMEYIDETWK